MLEKDVLGRMIWREGDGGRLARLILCIVDFSKHTFEGAEERLLPASGLRRRNLCVWCLHSICY